MVTLGTPQPARVYVPNQLYDMPLADLQQDSNQPRKYLDQVALDELAASVAEHSVIAPITFRVENGACFIVAGERRCIAARKAGLTTIPAVYTDSPRYEEISIAENTIRADLTAVEEAEALGRLMTTHDYKVQELAKVMGKALSTISELLSINRLPQAIRDECRKNPVVSRRTLIEIAAWKQERSMLKAYEAYKAGVNPEKKEKAGGSLTKAQSAVKALEATRRKIEALDAGEIVKEKLELAAALTGMKGAVETLLAAIAATATTTRAKNKVNRPSHRKGALPLRGAKKRAH